MGIRYLINYDLNSPGKDYKNLIRSLERMGARRVLLSQWAVRLSGTSAEVVRDTVWRCMDRNDRLLVVAIDGTDWASMNAMVDLNTI